MRSSLIKAAFLTAVALVAYTPASACPDIYGIPDFNCDGDLQIAVLGDSVVYGFGDGTHKGRGGYVLRTQKKLPKAAVQNLGVLGLRTDGLLQALKEAFDLDTAPKLKAALKSADIVVLDIGRNDYWLFKPVADIYKNIVEARDEIRAEVRKTEGLEPIVVTAVLQTPDRGGQSPWVKALDKLIMKGNSTRFPADLRFDFLSHKFLNSDRIHPNSAGYDAMAKAFLAYLKGPLTKKMHALRPDKDKDGLPDIYETVVSHTNPAVADSDHDGHSDGAEVLKLHTDPRVANP